MNQQVSDYEVSDGATLGDYIAVLRRRKWPALVATSAVALLSMLLAILLPSKYTSQATILIEEQEVPREYVVNTITSYAAQQIQVISQRVLTAESISQISSKFGLFVDPATNRRPPAMEVAQEFRDMMNLELVSADVIDPRSGRAMEATIAFTLSFESDSPVTAQQVTNELVTLFLDENLRTRTERVANTEEFLAAQSASLNDQLVRMERDIAEFKSENGDALPELQQYNLSNLERRSAELSDVDRRIRDLERRRLELDSELELLSPAGTQLGPSGATVLSRPAQLAALHEEYSRKLAVYHEKHPDMVQIRRQIQELTNNAQTSQVADHAASNNPAHIMLRTQLDSVVAETNALIAKRAELVAKVSRFEDLLARSPAVERDYNSQIRDYQALRERYADVKSKQQAAELAESMEQERKGERFVIVEPPSVPSEPSSPNRAAIVLVGAVLAGIAGIGMAMMLETFDGSVHTERALTEVVGAPPFAVIGYIETQSEYAHKIKMRWRFVYGAAAVAVAMTGLFHIYIKPLDVAWFVLLNALGL